METEATRLHVNSGSSLTAGYGLPSGPLPGERRPIDPLTIPGPMDRLAPGSITLVMTGVFRAVRDFSPGLIVLDHLAPLDRMP